MTTTMSDFEATLDNTVATDEAVSTAEKTPSSIRDAVRFALDKFLAHLDGQQAGHIYEMVRTEVEIPMLETIMKYTRGNQSRAAIMLGISRGTLRKLLKKYDLD